MAILTNIDETHFANVDLDIHSRSSLEPLVDALRRKVTVLYVGRVGRHYEAHLELSRVTHTPDATIRGFCALLRKLPKAERKLWDMAAIREFNIGIQAQLQPFSFAVTIAEGTLKEASSLNARIGVTVYAPEQKKP